MVRLFVLRHAETSWALPGMKDFDRGLDERGSGDLPRIAENLRRRDYLPASVICSPAVRTRMTLHGVMAAYQRPPRIDYVESLYSGSPEDYWQAIQSVEGPGDVMIVGHNPMCEIVAGEAAPRGEAAALDRLRRKFPTGALAVIDFPAERWADVRPGKGRLLDFVIPADLK